MKTHEWITNSGKTHERIYYNNYYILHDFAVKMWKQSLNVNICYLYTSPNFFQMGFCRQGMVDMEDIKCSATITGG